MEPEYFAPKRVAKWCADQNLLFRTYIIAENKKELCAINHKRGKWCLRWLNVHPEMPDARIFRDDLLRLFEEKKWQMPKPDQVRDVDTGLYQLDAQGYHGWFVEHWCFIAFLRGSFTIDPKTHELTAAGEATARLLELEFDSEASA